MSNINIHNADVLEYLKNYTGEKFHSVLADVPYGISFMGKSWDKYTPIQYQTWCSEWASELIKHLYPGSVCMFFGGTRTYHRLATGLEDAGFEIFDSMMFLYGSGFPKATDISKGIDKKFGLEREVICENPYNNLRGIGNPSWSEQLNTMQGKSNITKPNHPLAQKWNGYKTALKPAFEPIVLCRKPRGKETFVDCALNYGSGSLNVDGSKIPTEVDLSRVNKVDKGIFKYGNGASSLVGVPIEKQGRFPANLGLICDCECEPCECDYQTIGDSSRFFYTAKSSRKERNLGLEHLPETETQVTGWSGDGMPLRQNGTERKMPIAQNNHPTVKPIKLIEYLATMLKPPVDDSSILIPFSGSGSEIIGAMFAGWNVINAIEIDAGYCNIAENRISYWKQFSTYDKGLKGNRG